jgi:hypothetical protein
MNIFGLEYQPFWLFFIVPAVLIGTAVVICLWRIGSWLKEMVIELHDITLEFMNFNDNENVVAEYLKPDENPIDDEPEDVIEKQILEEG